MKKIFIFAALVSFIGLGAISCSSDDMDVQGTSLAKVAQADTLSKEQAMTVFSQTLSKAVTQNAEVRDFIKAQAMKRFDNGYDVFYPLVKDLPLEDGRTFKEVLSQYAPSTSSLDKIEQSVPLLNVFLPEFAGCKVSKLDTSDDELPVLYDNQFYVNGEVVDTLGANDLPGFNVLSVCESSTVCKKSASTRAASDLDINGEYEYIDEAFVPTSRPTRNIYYTEYDEPSEKADSGYVEASDLDPKLVKAWDNAKGNIFATRYLMYYGLNSEKEAVDASKIQPDVRDCIYGIRISPSGLTDILETAEGGNLNDHKLFYDGSFSVKSHEAARSTIFQRLLTGQKIKLNFYVEEIKNGEPQKANPISVYAAPEDLFNIAVDVNRRHKTKFRHTQYTYTINKSNFKAKWFYPMEHGCNTILDSWNIANSPLQRKVLVYVANPNEGAKIEKQESYSVQNIYSAETSVNFNIALSEAVQMGLSGKVSSGSTTTHTISLSYSISEKDLFLGDFQFDFFADYPIVCKKGNWYVLNRQGRSVIDCALVPVTTERYNQFRSQTK